MNKYIYFTESVKDRIVRIPIVYFAYFAKSETTQPLNPFETRFHQLALLVLLLRTGFVIKEESLSRW